MMIRFHDISMFVGENKMQRLIWNSGHLTVFTDDQQTLSQEISQDESDVRIILGHAPHVKLDLKKRATVFTIDDSAPFLFEDHVEISRTHETREDDDSVSVSPWWLTKFNQANIKGRGIQLADFKPRLEADVTTLFIEHGAGLRLMYLKRPSEAQIHQAYRDAKHEMEAEQKQEGQQLEEGKSVWFSNGYERVNGTEYPTILEGTACAVVYDDVLIQATEDGHVTIRDAGCGSEAMPSLPVLNFINFANLWVTKSGTTVRYVEFFGGGRIPN
jgi:hypothetical protein